MIAASMLVTNGGCGEDGPKMARVRGKITVDGKAPTQLGKIHFVPQVGPPAMGEIQPDGSFELHSRQPGDGAVVGDHGIYFSAPPLDSPTHYVPGEGFLPETQEMWEAAAAAARQQQFPPARYRALETSGLTHTVEEGSNTFDFDLEGD